MTQNTKPTKRKRFVLLSLCVGCGPNVALDEDGLCAVCGATATGMWLAKNQQRIADALEKKP